MVIYLIVFSLQCIQMLIFICIVTIMCCEGISISQLANARGDLNSENEPLLNQGVDEDQIEEILANNPEVYNKEDCCSI